MFKFHLCLWLCHWQCLYTVCTWLWYNNDLLGRTASSVKTVCRGPALFLCILWCRFLLICPFPESNSRQGVLDWAYIEQSAPRIWVYTTIILYRLLYSYSRFILRIVCLWCSCSLFGLGLCSYFQMRTNRQCVIETLGFCSCSCWRFIFNGLFPLSNSSTGNWTGVILNTWFQLSGMQHTDAVLASILILKNCSIILYVATGPAIYVWQNSWFYGNAADFTMKNNMQ